MRCEKNGCQLLVGYQQWLPCDRYVCPDCGADVLSGFARNREGQHLSDKQVSAMLGYPHPTQFYQDREMGPAPRIDPVEK